MRMLKYGFNMTDDGLVGQHYRTVRLQGLLMEPKKLKREETLLLKKRKRFFFILGIIKKL